MKTLTRTRLLAQGYSEQAIGACRRMSALARWTPLACATLGLVGVALGSPHYMLALGALTAIGAVGGRRGPVS